MNLVVFATLKGAMIAILGMSTPVAPQRSCLVVRHALLDQDTARGPEAWIVLAGYPGEFPCAYQSSKRGTVVSFVNPDGWRFEVKLDRREAGRWWAWKGPWRLSGKAYGP